MGNGWVQAIKPQTETCESVGIIGAGPWRSWPLADVLRRAGVQGLRSMIAMTARCLLTLVIPLELLKT